VLSYLLWVAGIPVIEFSGEEAAEACAAVAAIVEGTYHAAAACALLVAA
jgi:dihydroxyacetone kinase DhaKLM complex PTS-EIIA-like component DhaM